ncbi:unnamed protein product [Brassica rapa subsp. trilocularis]|uniref:(rape) hypothetical protein n=1 Tax=Brassica napus TaxID=3708 RepID=A0A816T233_BRANA|nr:unnamed protein product [Brassica napus]
MAKKNPSFSQAKEKKKNAASQDSDPPPSSSGVAPFISSISILGFGKPFWGIFGLSVHLFNYNSFPVTFFLWCFC